jgi:hypothetical protein
VVVGNLKFVKGIHIPEIHGQVYFGKKRGL